MVRLRTAAMVLSFTPLAAACSSQPGQPDRGDAAPPDGPEAGPPDLRFRGVGRALTYIGPGFYGSAPQPGQRGGIRTFEGAEFPIGWIDKDGFHQFLMLTSPSLPRYSTVTVADAAICPELLAGATAENRLLLAFGGNLTARDSRCGIISVKQLEGGPSYNYIRGGISSPSSPAEIVQQLQADETTRSMVVTAISEVDTLYTFVAEGLSVSPGEPLEQFETRIETPTLAEVADRAEALSRDGFVITASTWTGGNYALVGTRPVGSVAQYTAVFRDGGRGGGEAMVGLTRDGYAPVSFTFGRVSDDDGAWMLIGQKPR